MERSKCLKKIFIYALFVFLCAIVNSNVLAKEPEFTICTMSEEYKNWLTLSEDEQNETMRPAYCSNAADQSSISVYNMTSKIDSMFKGNMKASLPSKFDLRTTGYAPILKDQENSDSCWAFATTTALEVVVHMLQSKRYIFSPRHIEYAATRGFKNGKINEYGYNRVAGSGGDYHMSASYLANGLGPVLEEDMPFENNKNVIDISELDKEVAFDVNNIVLEFGEGGIPCTSTQRNQIKKYVYNYGAVAASTYMVLSDNYYNSKTGAYYYNGTNLINHAITIIGWDDNYDKSNFTSKNRPSANGAWIVQNSYGTEKSSEGYIYLSYEDVRLCDQIMAISDVDDDVDDNSYILDKQGYNLYFGYDYDNQGLTTAYAMNVFTKKSGKSELLKEVTIGSAGTGKYEIYFMAGNARNKKIEDMTLIGSGSLEHSGYVTHKLDNPLLLNNDITDYSIAVYYSMNTSTRPVAISMKDSTRYSTVSVESGKTFVSSNGKSWEDISNYDGKVLVASIKAFTDNVSYSIELGRPQVSERSQFYDIYIDFSYTNLNESKLEFELSGEDGFIYTPDVLECTNTHISISIDSRWNSGVRILTLYYDGNKIGEVEFTLNSPLSSSVYTIDNDGGYIYVPPKTYKTNFVANVKGLLTPSSLGTSGYMYTGMKVENYIIIVKGDPNGDGVISPLDYVMVKNHIMETSLIDGDEFFIAADYNSDSDISPLDYVGIKNYIMKEDS